MYIEKEMTYCPHGFEVAMQLLNVSVATIILDA